MSKDNEKWFRITYMAPNGGASRVVIANDVQDAMRKAETNETDLDTGIRIEQDGVWCAEKYLGKWAYKKKYYLRFNHALMTAEFASLEEAKEAADRWARNEKMPLTGLFIEDENDKTLACRYAAEKWWRLPDEHSITYPNTAWYLESWT